MSSLPTVRHGSTQVSTRYLKATHAEDTIPEAVASRLEHFSQHLVGVYARPPFILSHGKGSWVWDTTDRKFLDFSAGIAVNALGHGDTELAAIMADQAAKLVHTSNVFHNEWAGQLAALLVQLTKRDGGLGWSAGTETPAGGAPGAKVFFTNSGTEANEGAIKFARKVGKERWAKATGGKWEDSPKTGLVCFEHAFHGRSMGSLSLTTKEKYQGPFRPLIPGVKVGRINVVEEVNSLIDENTCGVFVEPVQGEGGVRASSVEFLTALRKRCDEVGAVLIFDEIQCGLYRTGTLWAHSSLPAECHPDIVTMAKPLANGFPIGAILTRDSIAEAMTVGSHGTTFGGSAIATRLAHNVLSRLSNPSFISETRTVAGHLSSRLEKLRQAFPEILSPEVRGRGFIVGLAFKDPAHPAQVVKMARERGVLLLTAGDDAVRLVPSLNVKGEEVDFAMDVVESCLSLLASPSQQ
ncbi:hypothetical protein BOTBODRAFT_38695 [Botryobasidium botryosum FD-172 SS1]|uniref:Acetylornithine transaminase n=1 Tax=Botryobasidium botryosum (strain FD-172 SS1) TaxID=930990 RepID=A0A067LW62_BOTB1|nr:hypothetical protein BOTBODRAFT_38695 [Botryobasidium botryosum FD-172 SS1]